MQSASTHWIQGHRLTEYVELQGHAIKNADLLAASGAVTLKGAERFDALQEDEAAVRSVLTLYSALILDNYKSQSQLAVQASRSTGIDIDQRTNELTQIASSISELAELFRDLGNMVVEQGTVLDSVEYNVQQTAAHAKGAVEELVVATKYVSLASELTLVDISGIQVDGAASFSWCSSSSDSSSYSSINRVVIHKRPIPQRHQRPLFLPPQPDQNTISSDLPAVLTTA